MTTPVSLSMTADQHEQLKQWLFPGDNKEVVTIALCGRRDGDRRHRLLVREIHQLPQSAYAKRSKAEVTWFPETIIPLLEKAMDQGFSVVKIHSHPSGYSQFSQTDDAGDSELLPMIHAWVEADIPHGSIVMLPDGQMFGRVLTGINSEFEPIHSINVVGDDFQFFYPDAGECDSPTFVASHKQIFGQGTTDRLQRISVGVVGCSGTGSPVMEQLVRLGVREMVMVDDDFIEDRNVNRILNSTMDDARTKRSKVDVLSSAIHLMGLGTRVIAIKGNLWDRDVAGSIAQCDVIFGCMDTVDGRYLLNKLATYYVIPYFDIGIKLDAIPDGPHKGKIREVCGTIHYLQPGKSSLMSRGLLNMEQVKAAGLRRNDPKAHSQQTKDGYISGITENRPAVISVNMLGASLAVTELLARIHPFREKPNSEYASVIFSLSSMEIISEPEDEQCSILAEYVGAGDTEPFLGELELSIKRDVA